MAVPGSEPGRPLLSHAALSTLVAWKAGEGDLVFSLAVLPAAVLHKALTELAPTCRMLCRTVMLLSDACSEFMLTTGLQQ